MPKRPRCNDDDDENNLAGLVKNHISEREVNTGVLQEVHMNTVYKKTLARLFQGQRNVANNNAAEKRPVAAAVAGACVLGAGGDVDMQPGNDKQPVYKQLGLSTSGTCIRMPSNPFGPSVVLNCCSCVNSSCSWTGSRCQTCGGPVGSLCLLTCSGCASIACTNCDAIRQCLGCGRLACGSCAMPRETGCLCSLCG